MSVGWGDNQLLLVWVDPPCLTNRYPEKKLKKNHDRERGKLIEDFVSKTDRHSENPSLKSGLSAMRTSWVEISI